MIGVIVAGIAPAMKASGYRKQGFKFRQDVSAGVIRLMNAQCSDWNNLSEGKFTINLGVYHRDLAALHDMMPVVESPLVQHCVVQRRIGWLMPVGRDQWWSFDGSTDLPALGAEVALALSTYGGPWLERVSSLEGAREFLASQNHFFLAAMASHAMGQRNDAEHWLARAIDESPSSRDRIEAWRKEHLE